MYSAQVLDHFQNPRNAGELPDADVTVQLENPACGDILKLSLKVSDGVITAARFKAKGCVPAMACASLLTEMLVGRRIEQVQQLHREQLVRAIGGLPKESAHASHLAMDALKASLKQLSERL
jgi:nitrogen fixation protein NifU and related proteins